MSFLKKQSAGFYLTALSILVSAVGLAYGIMNGNTDSFRSVGTSSVVIACAAAGIAAQLLYLVLGQKPSIAADVMPVLAGVTLMVAAAQFISPRVNTIASIMTFTSNAQTMADLSSAVIATAALLIAVVLNIISAFLKVSRESV